MFIAISILVILASILLTFVVLIQNSKGGGLAANFATGNQTFGVRQTADFLEKATWTLAIIILALCILATAFTPSRKQVNDSVATEILKGAEATSVPVMPVFPAGDAADGAAEVPAASAEEPVSGK
ncbi:MAG TPA: preprotein translocase subunit SecG [Candidatus Coprenecus pullistercoris]|nr:preprotein translocase subunit SecG [Candidatus Coprenecus pullistercoris]